MRDTDFVTVFPTGVNTAATFNRALMRLRGIAMGKEHRGKSKSIPFKSQCIYLSQLPQAKASTSRLAR